MLLRNHALCYRVGDVDGSGGGEEKRIPVASITAVEIDNEMRYAARNSGAILAQFWRNSGAISGAILAQLWRNSLTLDPSTTATSGASMRRYATRSTRSAAIPTTR